MVIVAGQPVQLPVHHCAPPSTQFHQIVSCRWSRYHRLLQNVERKSKYRWAVQSKQNISRPEHIR